MYCILQSEKVGARGCSIKKGVLENLLKFARKDLRQSLFLNKVAGSATLLKRDSCEFLRKPIL